MPWVALGPSVLFKRWCVAAAWVCGFIAFVLATHALLSFRAEELNIFSVLLLLLTSAANAGGAFYLVRSSKQCGTDQSGLGYSGQSYGVCVDGEGAIWVHEPAAPPQERVVVTPLFISSQLLIVLAGGKPICIWRDALSRDAFRRLTVAARWPKPPPAVPVSQDLMT